MSSKRSLIADGDGTGKRFRSSSSVKIELIDSNSSDVEEREADGIEALYLDGSADMAAGVAADEGCRLRQRKRLSLSLKLDVLRRLETGERQTSICKDLSLAGSTVRTILKNAERIKESAKYATSLNVVRTSRAKSAVTVEMEQRLCIWIEDRVKRGFTPSAAQVKDKARSLYEELRKEMPNCSVQEEFYPSPGWLTRLRERISSYGGIDIPVEPHFIMDDHAVEIYKSELVEIIKEGGYTAQQVFNVDETGLFWKRMPSKSFISKEEEWTQGFKASKDRLTLLFGGNAAGDFKLKPLVVYHSETPRQLKGYSKNCLPVIWRANRKAWVNMEVFESWFTSYFCPALKEYCIQNNLENKALLILDTAAGHPTTLEDLGQNVKVIFLPPHTNSFVQPMDQGVIRLFKVYYTLKMFTQAFRTVDGEGVSALRKFWKDYSIRHAIENIGCAWDEISYRTMHVAWKNLWTDCVYEFPGTDEPEEALMEKILELGKKLGFDELEVQDVQELIDSHRQELSSAEMLEMEQLRLSMENGFDDDVEAGRALTVENLSEFFRQLDSALAVISENDPDMQRSSFVSRGIHELANCYRELYNEKKKAKKQLSYFSQSSRTVANKNAIVPNVLNQTV